MKGIQWSSVSCLVADKALVGHDNLLSDPTFSAAQEPSFSLERKNLQPEER
jgi:hypothetical protein